MSRSSVYREIEAKGRVFPLYFSTINNSKSKSRNVSYVLEKP